MKWLVNYSVLRICLLFSKNYKGKNVHTKQTPLYQSRYRESTDVSQACSTTAPTRDCTRVIKGKCVTVLYADKQLNMKMLYKD